MFFKIKNTHHFTRDTLKGLILNTARSRIVSYQMLATECQLHNYLEKTEHAGLKQTCINILSNIKIVFDDGNNATVLIRDKKYNNLAAIITYGKNGAAGSKILKDAFYWGD